MKLFTAIDRGDTWRADLRARVILHHEKILGFSYRSVHGQARGSFYARTIGPFYRLLHAAKRDDTRASRRHMEEYIARLTLAIRAECNSVDALGVIPAMQRRATLEKLRFLTQISALRAEICMLKSVLQSRISPIVKSKNRRRSKNKS